MLERLFPNEQKFFAEFGRIAGQLTGAAALLEQGFEEPSRWPELLVAIEDIQREADAGSHTIDLSMHRMFVTPLDPEDILRLSARLRRIVDIIAALGACEEVTNALESIALKHA